MNKVWTLIKTNLKPRDEIKEEKSTPIKLVSNFLFATLIFLFIFLSYELFKPLDKAYGTPAGLFAKLYGTILLFLLVISYIILRINHKTNLEVNLFYILMVSFIFKLVYMLYTGGHTRQHDTWGHNGHYYYAEYIYEHFSLPNHVFDEKDIYQFYHPPIFHFISAIWMKIFPAFNFNVDISSTKDLFCSVQILTTFFTYLITYYSIKTLRVICKNRTSLYVGAIFVCCYPRLIQFSAQLNNDVLACLFVICSIFRLFKYVFEKKSYKNIALSALYLGLAMSTKLSAVIVVVGYASYFIYLLIKSFKKSKDGPTLKTIILHYTIFLLIVAPIGLWFQFYAHYVYGIPFNFVYRALSGNIFTGTRDYVLSHTYLNITEYDAYNSGIFYTNGFVNFLARFISPLLVQDYQISHLFAGPYDSYNILTYAIKSTIFGEFNYWGGEGFGAIALLSGYLLWFFVIGMTIFNIIKKRYDLSMMVSFALVISIIMFYLYLQITMPYGCSMDARYIVPILLPLGILIMKNLEFFQIQKRSGRILTYILIISTLSFSLCSNLFYYMAI